MNRGTKFRWVESANTNENLIGLDYYLDYYYLAGLRPEISDKVKSLLPISLNFAEKYAMHLEGSKVEFSSQLNLKFLFQMLTQLIPMFCKHLKTAKEIVIFLQTKK